MKRPRVGPTQFRRQTRLQLAVWIVVIFTALALAIGQAIWTHKRHFDHASLQIASQITDRALIAETALEGFAAFAASLPAFDHDAAADYADTLLERYPFLYKFEVAVRTLHAERAQLEQQLAEIYPGFEIRRFDYADQRKWIDAPSADDYYPIVFQWPYFGDERQIVGLDLYSSDILSSAMRRSVLLGLPAATEPFVLAENVSGYVLHRAFDDALGSVSEPLTANRYALLALRSDSMFGDTTKLHPEFTVELSYETGHSAADDGSFLLRAEARPASNLERFLLPAFEQRHSLAPSVPSQPFLLTSRSQMGWQDINLTLIVGLLGLMIIGPWFSKRFAVAYFDNKLAGMDSEGLLYQMANFDALTGVANRHRLLEEMELNLLRAQRDQAHLCLFFLDIDNFKLINDRLGHAAGDAVLIEFSQRLGDLLRAEELLGRLGGDEFIILTNASVAEVHVVALIDRIKRALDKPLGHGKQAIPIAVSIGHACYPEDGRNIAALMDAADKRMYVDKLKHRESDTAA